jgi:hypothetical protein
VILPVKHYTPSDPEFHSISKTITHISRVRKEPLGTRTYIDAEPSSSKMAKKSRQESVDKIRGV